MRLDLGEMSTNDVPIAAPYKEIVGHTRAKQIGSFSTFSFYPSKIRMENLICVQIYTN